MRFLFGEIPSTILLVLALLPLGRAWARDGGGFNGPTDSTLVIPELLDLGVDSADVQRSVSTCFGGLFSDFRNVALGSMAQDATAPDCSSRWVFTSNGGVGPGELNPTCLASTTGSTPAFELGVAPWLHQLSASYQAGLDFTSRKQSSLIAERSFPVLGFARLEKGYQIEAGADRGALFASGLYFILGEDFDSAGHRVRMLPSGNPRHVPPASDFQVTVNGRSFVDCVQAEVQKAPQDLQLPTPRPVQPLPPELCPELSSWFRIRQEGLSTPASILDRSQFMVSEWEKRREVIQGLYRNYEAGSLDFNRIEGCLKGDEFEAPFFQTLYSEFFERTLDRLRQAKSSGIRRFVQLTDRKYRLNSRRPLFRLTGHFDQNSPSSLMAGVHRASGSIYMDLARIPRDEWYIIFVHEMLHKLDSKLQDAVLESSITPGQFAELRMWVEKSRLESLPPEVREDLDRWLKAGMDRGLNAEFRSWMATFKLYREGLSEGLWSAIPRYDALIDSASNAGPRADQFVYQWLSARARLPVSGIFSFQATQQAIQALQEKAITDPEVLDLGSLKELVQP